jgi:hypothetical protein
MPVALALGILVGSAARPMSGAIYIYIPIYMTTKLIHSVWPGRWQLRMASRWHPSAEYQSAVEYEPGRISPMWDTTIAPPVPAGTLQPSANTISLSGSVEAVSQSSNTLTCKCVLPCFEFRTLLSGTWSWQLLPRYLLSEFSSIITFCTEIQYTDWLLPSHTIASLISLTSFWTQSYCRTCLWKIVSANYFLLYYANFSCRSKLHIFTCCKGFLGRAVAQAVSHWLPTAAARVHVHAACGVCGGQSGTGAGFHLVLRFPLPIFLPISPSSSITRGWHNRPIGGRSAEWTEYGLHPLPNYTN